MKFPRFVASTVARKPLVGLIAGLTALSAVWGGAAHADPAEDGMAKLKELTKQAEQMVESVQAADSDLDRKLMLQSEAESQHAQDMAALDGARAQVAVYQGDVDKLAAAVYMGGRTDGTNAFLTAASPQSFIDKLTVQRAMANQMSMQMQLLQQTQRQAETISAASAESAANAKAAADAAFAIKTDLERKQVELQKQVALVKATYYTLPSAQQALLGPGGAIPTVGMGGLIPNARALAAYIIDTYPGVQSIGGVRADPIPDHPSGHAIDIMIGSDMALGDAINADIQSQSGRFNVRYTMWRVANHFNHVHVTVD